MATQASDSYIVDINEQTINAVLQQSMTVPVLLDFWADWCQPCKNLAPVLEKLAREYQGRFILARVNADEQPMIAQQLGVRSLPTLKLVVQGQLAGELMGAQPEAELRKFLEPHVGAAEPVEEQDPFLAQIDRARRMGAWDQACEALRAAIEEQPKRQEYRAAYAEVLLDMQELDAAGAAIDEMELGVERSRVSARLLFARELVDAPSPEDIAQLQQADPENPLLQYQQALYALLQGDVESGLRSLLLLMQNHGQFRDEAARKGLLAAFDLLGKDDPLVSRYRRKMFALLH